MLTAAALIGSAGISSAAQYAINQANLKNAANLNESSIALANTQHQREVADLRLAGLNPILSANGSGAAVPSLTQVDQKSLAESIPGTAKELARYASDQYQLNNQSMALQNELQSIVNSAAEAERGASQIRAENDIMMAEAEKDALLEEMGQHHNGNVTSWNLEEYGKFKGLIREGIRSDLKNRANSNLRNWIPLLSGGLGQGAGAINSGAKAANIIKWLFH